LITFRYHVVTLVGVFLALGVGVLFGVSFIDQSTVEGLKGAQTRLGARNEELRDRIVALEKQNEAYRTYVSSSRDLIVRGALRDHPVLIIAFESTPVASVDAVTQTIQLAGARLDGPVTLSDMLDLKTDEGRRKLASLLEASSTEPRTLSEGIVSRLAAAATGRDLTFLQTLIDGGMASGRLPAAGSVPEDARPELAGAVVIVGGEGSKELNERLVMPLTRALAGGPVTTAVTEAESVSLRVVGPLREAGDLNVITVDGVDTPLGQAALAAGLQAGFQGQFGNYGLGDGATSALPAG
jgi:hypothetical protein